MTVIRAIQIYKANAGLNSQRPSKSKCYLHNNTWHLLSKSGELLAVVHPSGKCVYGAVLQVIWGELAKGLPTRLLPYRVRKQ